MINFSPKLQDSTDDQLWDYINTSSPHFGTLASDELTRRSLKELQKTMADLDKSTSDYSNRLLGLTFLLFISTFVLIVLTTFLLPFSWLNKILIILFVGVLLYWIMRDWFKPLNKNSD
jgi:membrane protein implicated in regulation of membrane protease activity